jgi:anti-sigma-K factor RskA
VRLALAVIGTVALAFGVAAAIERAPPRFAAPPLAIVRDGAQHPLWSIRLAPRAHEIAVDAVRPAPWLEGHAYQLWLRTNDGSAPQSLGLLPARGRKVIPEIPALVTRLAGGRGSGELLVSREPDSGSRFPQPSGPIVFRAALADGG